MIHAATGYIYEPVASSGSGKLVCGADKRPFPRSPCMPDVPSHSNHPASPEERFLQFARTGDKKVIQELIGDFADRAYNQARRIIGRDDGAEDAVQDAYVRLVGTAKRYDGSVPFAAWWGRLVHTAAIDYRRQTQRQRRFSGSIEQGVSAMNPDHSATSESADPPELESLRAALESLPDRYRDPLTMHYLGGLSRIETAQALGIAEETIKTQLARGLEFLRAKLGRAGMAATSAGLVSVFASIPTYAAPATLKAGLAAAASERLIAAAQQVSQRIFSAKKVSSMAMGTGLFKAAVVGVIAVTATVMLSLPSAKRSDHPVEQAFAVDLARGLIGHWKFDETDGQFAADSSGNGFNGTLNDRSAPGWSDGKVGGALDFDSASSAVLVGSPIALNDLTRYTIAAWILPRTFGQPEPIGLNNHGRILDKRSRNSESSREGTVGWSLLISNQVPASSSGTFHFRQAFSSLEGWWGSQSDSVELGLWQHIALTYDNSSTTNLPAFYINGTRVTTVVEAEPAGTVIPDAASALVIGNVDTPTRAFDGILDDVRLYGRILTPAEITALVDRAP
jgi:RNA polymerase sigma-70 factor (ECF subfamily)